MQVRHIFVGIDLGDKNSVARIAVDRGEVPSLNRIGAHRDSFLGRLTWGPSPPWAWPSGPSAPS